MGRFNLLDEPWISVLSNETGEKEDVSLLEFFHNAEKYCALTGEMETQNFAVMRFLLSVIQTVFSRFDIYGNVLPGVNLNEQWIQTDPVEEDDLEEYCEATSDCWNELLKRGTFPEIVTDYLVKWRERFYLFDEQYPFYQVNQRDMNGIMKKISSRSNPTIIYGKNLNRTISESENKEALFSPIAAVAVGKRSSKDILSAAELVRWLLTFQGYSGLADKVSLTSEYQRPSKGWLFDLGGIFLQGETVFETLIMNYLPESPTDTVNETFAGRIQRPCWESDGNMVVQRLCTETTIDNLSELYTNWSRAIYIDPSLDLMKPVSIQVVKLPEIDHSEHSIEPMTLWRRNDSGPNKDHMTPKKHSPEQALWRSFGLISMSISHDNKAQKQPGIFMQYGRIAKAAGSRWTDLVGISMEDDGNPTSRLPVDEIADSFKINDLVMTDTNPDGWIIRINDVVEMTNFVASVIFGSYLKRICEIRDFKTNPPDPAAAGFISEQTAILYSDISFSFKDWLQSVEPDDSKEEKIREWNEQLRSIVLKRGENLYNNCTMRDLIGIEKENSIENIAVIYWQLVREVDRKLGKGGRS